MKKPLQNRPKFFQNIYLYVQKVRKFLQVTWSSSQRGLQVTWSVVILLLENYLKPKLSNGY